MPEAHQQRIGRRIALLRERQGWSQRALAKVMGIDQSALSRIEAGRRRVTAAELQRLAHVFNVSLDDLLAASPHDDEDPSPARAFRPNLPAARSHSAYLGDLAEADGTRWLQSAPQRAELRDETQAPPRPEMRRSHASSPSPPAMPDRRERSVDAAFTPPDPGAQRQDELVALGLPPDVAGVIDDWRKLRDAAVGDDLTLPWSHGRSAQGKPATSSLLSGSAPLPRFAASQLPPDEVLYDRLARFWRNELRVEPDGPLPDLVTLLEDGLGVQVIVARVGAAASRASVSEHAADSVETPSCASLLVDGVPFLFVNAARPVVLQRYALAHGFAHLVLAHGEVVDERIEWSRANPREAAANDFAEEFLAPAQAVARWYDRRGEQTPGVETLLDLGNAFGISVWAALYRSRAVERARAKTFSALRAELQRHEWELLPRQAFLGGLRDTLSALTPGEIRDPGAFGPPAVLRVPGAMRRWSLQALGSGRLSLEEVASCLRLDPAALAAELERLGLA